MDLEYQLSLPVIDIALAALFEACLLYTSATLELVLLGTILAVILGLALGVLTASHKNHWQDHMGRFFSVGTVSLPTFWVRCV